MESISVILPFYNRSHTIRRALSSIYQQTLQPLEVIAIDDASTDGGSDIVAREFPDVVLLKHSENRGVSAARNTGIQHANGDWLAFLDSDDEWLSKKLQTQLQAIEQSQSEFKVVHSDEIWIRNGVRVNPHAKHQKRGGDIFEHCLPLCAISPSCVMLHKEVFEQVGLFDEQLPACEDYDMWLRVCLDFPVCYVNEPLIKKYGGHEDQLSRKYWGMDRFRIVALEKILTNPSLVGVARDMVIQMLTKKATIMLQGARKRSNQEIITWCEQLLTKYGGDK